jgi:hypothetical protein
MHIGLSISNIRLNTIRDYAFGLCCHRPDYHKLKLDMTDTQSLAIDILNLVPDNSKCFINAPSLNDDSDILKLLQPSSRDFFDWELKLTINNKQKLIDLIVSDEVETSFHKIEIESDNDLLFIAYDGFSGVKVKDRLMVPNWFAEKYSDTLMF